MQIAHSTMLDHCVETDGVLYICGAQTLQETSTVYWWRWYRKGLPSFDHEHWSMLHALQKSDNGEGRVYIGKLLNDSANQHEFLAFYEIRLL